MYGNKVEIWGTLDQSAFNQVFQEIGRTDKEFYVVNYSQKDSRTFENELVNAIAENRGPDAVVMSHEDLVTFRPKLQPIPYSTFPERTLKDNYIDGAEIFARPDGLYAIPFLVDPVIMYWNRDILAASGLAVPPTTWEALTDVVSRVTLRDATRNILQATVAFGEYRNVVRFKEVLLTLLMQSGSRLVEEGSDRYIVALDQSTATDGRRPLSTTLQFYVEFSNASSPLYSWNRTFQDDTTAFLGEKLAIYFTYGSEAERLRSQNPNLNFDVAGIPQGAGATVKRVYGKFYGLAMIRGGTNSQGTYRALVKLSDPAIVTSLGDRLSLAPASRGLLAIPAGDPIRQTIFNQTLISRGWLDPGPQKSSEILGQMVEDVVSNSSRTAGAASDASRRLELAF